MIWPFENDTGAVENKLAKRSVQANRKRNILVSSIIFLAAFLLSFSMILIVNATIQTKIINRVDNSGEALATIMGIVFVLLCTAGAAIKNIIYVSVLQRVREFARLRTIGATCRQITSMVKKERQRLSRRYILAGILAGLLVNASLPLDFYPVQSILCVIAAGAFIWMITCLAFRAPARLAASTSPLAALRQDGQVIGSHRKSANRQSSRIAGRRCKSANRRGSQVAGRQCKLVDSPASDGKSGVPASQDTHTLDKSANRHAGQVTGSRRILTPAALGLKFFFSAPKKTLYTFSSLILSGVLLFSVFSVIKAVNVETLAKGPYREDSGLYIQLKSTAEEESTYNLMKNSPFTEELRREVEDTPGVTAVYDLKMLNAVISGEDGGVETSINSIVNEKSFEKQLMEGSLPGDIIASGASGKDAETTEPEGTPGNDTAGAGSEAAPEKTEDFLLPVIVNRASPYYQSLGREFAVGDTFTVEIDTGYQKKTVQARVSGFIEDKDTGVILYTKEENLAQITEINCDLIWYVCLEKGKEEEAADRISGLLQNDDRVTVNVLADDTAALEEYFHNAETVIGILVGVIGLFSFLNLLNTCITNAMSRRHDYALLEATGMTGRQIQQAWRVENLSYLLGSFLGSCLLGIPLGIFLCSRIARISGIFYIEYRFPFTFVLLYCIAAALVYGIMTIYQNWDYRQAPVVERIRVYF